MVEAAFVAPVFFLLIFAVIEFGFMFRNYLTVSNASSTGARAASVSGNDAESDYFILRSVNHGLAAANLEDLEMIVVYEALTPNDGPPANCIAGTGTSQTSNTATGGTQRGCNVYHVLDLSKGLVDAGGPTDHFRCGLTSIDRFWCPTTRKATLSGTGPGYVGVYIQLSHEMITGFFGQDRLLTDHRVIRIEPERQ